MNIQKIIVHEIVKNVNSTGSDLHLSEELMPVNQDSTDLIEALLKSYQGDRILYAEFDTGPGRFFPSAFNNYRVSSRTEIEFIDYTKNTTGHLEHLIQNERLAKGGYVLFAEYSHATINYTAIFLIRNTNGKLLNRTENTFQIQNIQYLDTNHLAMACRINETKLSSEEANYISFTSLRQSEVSSYFLEWIAIRQIESSKEFTDKLYHIINHLNLPRNPENGREYTIDEVRNKVYEIAHANASGNINIRTIGQEIYGDEDYVVQFAEENNISIDTEFKFHKKSLKKFIQVEVNRDGIKLKFSRGDVDTKVKFASDDPNMVIIESETFANALRLELNDDE